MRKAMLMTAGLGTRLRPFTAMMPKPLLPVMGTAMAQFALDALAGAGVEKVVANLHHLAERARAGLQSLDGGGCKLEFSDESASLLGSAGGIRHALPKLGLEPFYLLNSDVLCDVDLQALARTHSRLRALHGVRLTLTVFPAGPAPGKYREILLDTGRGLVTGLGELATGRPFFVGAAIIEPEAIASLPDQQAREFVPEILLPAIQASKAGFHAASGIWHDIGSPELWRDAHLHLIQAWEAGRLPAGWKTRIEESAYRAAPSIWVGKSAGKPVDVADWTAPTFWSPLRSSDSAPARLGPEAVLYGDGSAGSSSGAGSLLVRGIGYGGCWVSG